MKKFPSLSQDRRRVCARLVPLLLHDNIDAVIEAARAYGNYSTGTAARVCVCVCIVNAVINNATFS